MKKSIQDEVGVIMFTLMNAKIKILNIIIFRRSKCHGSKNEYTYITYGRECDEPLCVYLQFIMKIKYEQEIAF